MVKLRNFQAYKTEDTPDFIMQEIEDLTKDMAEKLKHFIEKRSGNIVLAAMNFLMAGSIKYYVSEDPEQIRKAAQNYAIALIKNVQMVTGVEMFHKENE